MLAKRIIPCLDVKNGQVVKGIQFKNHEIVGNIVELAKRYANEGADELVFYDISASTSGSTVSKMWVNQVAEQIDIPFCVAGGIKSAEQAKEILQCGADKISINSPALAEPSLITRLQDQFGRQCIVVGIDSYHDKETNTYKVKHLTGDVKTSQFTQWSTFDWVEKVQQLGCGEIVLNAMNQDGVRSGFDIDQLKQIRSICDVPLIASGGAGRIQHFIDVFQHSNVDGALAATVFHKNMIEIDHLKAELNNNEICVRQLHKLPQIG
ncbi:imidazole glycerol phosphate synthase subunit HisF [Parashewanella spongiae]|uniref:Imidazole glycerol phosphate synthase subunit HisF n=1 Tax=Parashewanella spongiae TaxID=342950 RepID=A0A3A6U1B6_9GAMM|nr:imidazole glycerol phosphate synthase subunit HisF [Parashewanella spongiae]MCL1076830.1 imidazole glycerol phosphate synthase subunit HisF [Parashewanella spongiae]RJY19198.1 imidazole glycerol phosphate synthase subunit HisF [Parashewanella spongiae]